MCTDPLVSIYKRVIHDETIAESRGLLLDGGICYGSEDLLEWCRQGGIKYAVPQPCFFETVP